jgi:DNA primase small subunit
MGAAKDDNEEYEFDDDAVCPTPTDAKSIVSSSSPQSSSSNETKKSTPADSSVVFSPELLGMYYSRLFPYHLLYSWLSYDPATVKPINNISKTAVASSSSTTTTTFPRREFSMTIEPSPGNEVYIRYQSFLSQEELAAAIIKRRPTKIDIGAVFNHPPRDNKSLPAGKLQTQERELVFDIDLTDYDSVRNCGCDGAKICHKCWKFMGMAIKVMDEGLKTDFAFEHVAWFYSGRRGVHCWVCDDKARKLTNEARSAVASYFEVCLRVF